MQRRLSKKEWKFLAQLGVCPDENLSLEDVRNNFMRDINQNLPNSMEIKQNIPNVTTKPENVQSSEIETNTTIPTSVIASTAEGVADINRNIQIASSNVTSTVNGDSVNNNVNNSAVIVTLTSAITTPIMSSVQSKSAMNSEKSNTTDSSKFSTNSVDSNNIENSVTLALAKTVLDPTVQTEQLKSAMNTENINAPKTVSSANSVNSETNIGASAIPSTFFSPPAQIIPSSQTILVPGNYSMKNWAQLVEDDESSSMSSSSSSQSEERGYVKRMKSSEIAPRIQIEKEKYQRYESKINRLKKELAILKHKRDIAMLSLSILEGMNSDVEPKVTKASAPIENSDKNSSPIESIAMTSASGFNDSAENSVSIENTVQNSVASGSSVIHSLPIEPTARNSALGLQIPQDDPDIQCYNCSSRGHYSFECTRPRRVKGSCFHCGSTTHVLKNCPRKLKFSAIRSKQQVGSSDSECESKK